MSFWYETVSFKRETSCENCREKVARRASEFTVIDADGRQVESFIDDDFRADYLVRCEKCGKTFEVQSPEDVTRYKRAEGTDFPTRTVTRLT